MTPRRWLAGLALFIFALAAASSALVSANPTGSAAELSASQSVGGAAPQTEKKATWGPSVLNGVSLFPSFRDLGVGIYQTSVFWSSTAPTRPAQSTDPNDPAYQWPASLDEAIAEAGSYGMKVAVTIVGAPPWANGGRSWKWAPKSAQDFADFATAVARRYPSVHLWLIWGEPNRKPNFGPLTAAPPTGPLNHAQARAPRLYAQILDAAYGALKGVDPANLVIGGNTFTAAGPGAIHTYQWIRYMRLPNGSRPRMDMYGHNPFCFRKPNLHAPPSPRGQVDFSDLRRLGRMLDRTFPGPRLKLYLSEWGVPTDKKDAELGFSVSRAVQARWIRAAFRIVRGWSRIYTLGWSHPFDTRNPRFTVGLLDSAGNPKPGYYAFQAG
jgi:hypothetical protein